MNNKDNVTPDLLHHNPDFVRAKRTDPKDWKRIPEGGRARGQIIDPIPYVPHNGEGDKVDVKISAKDLQDIFDDNGDIWYCKVHKWALPHFDVEDFYERLVAQMCNYMLHLVLHNTYTPQFYRLQEDHVITGNHVAQCFGCQHARMLKSHPSMKDVWSTRKLLSHSGACAKNMIINAFQDMYHCLHIANKWEEGCEVVWDDVSLNASIMITDGTSTYCIGFAIIEEAFNAC